MEKPCQEEPFQSYEEGTAQQDGSSVDDYDTAFDNDPFQLSYQKHSGNAFKILLGLYKGHYFKFFLSTVFYVIKHSPSWVLPIVTANILNCVTGRRADSMSVILLNALIIGVLVVMNVPMNYLHTHFRSSAIRDVEAGLRSSLVHKIQQLSIPYHKEIQSGRLQSKIIRDVEAVETLSSQMFVSLLNISINICVALSITIFKSRVIFLFFILAIPVAAFSVVLFRSPIKRHNQRFRREMEETSAKVMEMVELVPVTRAHALEQEEIRKMDSQLHQIAKEGYQLDMIQSTFGAVSWACFQLFQLMCLIFTSSMALRGKIQAGDIVLYQSYFTTIVNQVSALITLLPTISKGMESVNSIGEILNAPDVEDNRGKVKLSSLEGQYEFQNITYSYPGTDHTILKGFTLQVKPHETIAFVGESGAGKTTLLNLLTGFCLPTTGMLTVDGRDITKIDLHSYRNFLAVVPQSTILFSGTIRDNITYGVPSISEEELQRVISAAGLTDVIASLPQGLDTKAGEHGDKLSGGQKQRISIARALIRNPQVIILDEATSALDSISERQVQKALDNLTRGRTTFIVAHRLSTIQNADRIVVLKNGICVESGTFTELMEKKGEFYRMKSSQS